MKNGEHTLLMASNAGGAGSCTPDFDPAIIIFKRKVHLQHQPESSTQDVGIVVDLHDHVILSLEAHDTPTILS